LGAQRSNLYSHAWWPDQILPGPDFRAFSTGSVTENSPPIDKWDLEINQRKDGAQNTISYIPEIRDGTFTINRTNIRPLGQNQFK
jgi:hypothetical protein